MSGLLVRTFLQPLFFKAHGHACSLVQRPLTLSNRNSETYEEDLKESSGEL